MKKFYTLALSAAVAMSVSAADLTNAQAIKPKSASEFAKFTNAGSAVKKSFKAPAKVAAEVDDVTGDYTVSYYVEFQEGGGPYSNEMTVTSGTKRNTIVLNIPFANGGSTLTWKLTGTLNTATGSITFKENQSSGFTGATVAFLHWDSTAQKWDETPTEITAVYDGTAIVFDEDDCMGLQAASGGFYTLFDMITMTKIVDDPNADPNEGWTSLGNAKFVDAWILPGIGLDQWDNEYEVELQQNDTDKNVYRLVDPYKGNFPGVAANQFSATKHGYIQFNVSDPDHVSFDLVEAGFANSSAGISSIYCYNTLGFYAAYLGYEPAEIVEALGNDIIYTAFKDGVVTLGSREAIDEDSGEKYTDYDACFSLSKTTLMKYTWTDEDDQPLDMTGRIVFPDSGVDAIEIDSDNSGEVKYYNLQGVQLAAPVAGQLVIRVQGNKAAKTIIR